MGNLFSSCMSLFNYDKKTEDTKEEIEKLIEERRKSQERYLYSTYGVDNYPRYPWGLTEPLNIR